MTDTVTESAPPTLTPPAARRPTRFTAPGHVRGGARLPLPGEVIDLSAPDPDEPDPAPEPQNEPHPEPDTPEPEKRIKLEKKKPPESEPAPAPEEPEPEPEKTTDTAAPAAEEPYAALGRAASTLADAIAASSKQAHTTITIQQPTSHQKRQEKARNRRRAGLYNLSAAAAGYWAIPMLLGPDISLPDMVTDLMNKVSAEASIAAALVIGTGLTVGIWTVVDRPAAKYVTSPAPAWAAVRWICRIPLASAVVGILLWAPAWQ